MLTRRGQALHKFYSLTKGHYCKMVDNIKDVLVSVAKTSTIKQARITSVIENSCSGSEGVGVEVLWSCSNLAASERTCNLSNYLVQDDKITTFQPFPASKNMILRQTSNSGRLTACIMTSEKDKDAEYVMVMDHDGSMTTVDLKAADKHGKVYADEEFSCLEWSPDETMIVYVAEKRQPKPTSFLTPLKNGNEDGRGQEYVYRNDWGEQMTGKHQAVVCLLNVNTKEVVCHELPDKLSPGSVVWTPDGNGLFGVAVVTQPYRLGIIYCHNRESKLFHMDLTGNFTVISEECSNIRTPRVSPDGRSIAFLRTRVGGPHAKCSQLCLLSWPSKKEKTVIDIIARKKKIHGDCEFFGIYTYTGLPRRCWLRDSERLVFSTISHSAVVSYVVHTTDGTIVKLPHLGSHQVMDVYRDFLLVNFSTLTSPNQILLGHVPGKSQEGSIVMKKVTASRDIPEVPNHYYCEWEFLNDTPHPNPNYSDISISVLYCGPLSNEEGTPKRPLICWPHGGPHSTVCNSYIMAATFFVRLGYSVLFPNYRGSLGFGQDGVYSLPGHCGLTDVDDVHKATLSCLERFPDVLDESQVFLNGGSHGGFLVTHLAAQYPDFYKAVAARNPVISIPAMAATSDIADWTFVESGLTYEHGKVPDGAALSKMLELSPISRIDNIKAPVLLLVGKNDARVPPSQSFNFHRMLLARGIETEFYLYDDCHPLSKMEVETDSMIHIALWFEKHRTGARE